MIGTGGARSGDTAGCGVWTAVVVIVLSVIVHSITALPVSRRYGEPNRGS